MKTLVRLPILGSFAVDDVKIDRLKTNLNDLGVSYKIMKQHFNVGELFNNIVTRYSIDLDENDLNLIRLSSKNIIIQRYSNGHDAEFICVDDV